MCIFVYEKIVESNVFFFFHFYYHGERVQKLHRTTEHNLKKKQHKIYLYPENKKDQQCKKRKKMNK